MFMTCAAFNYYVLAQLNQDDQEKNDYCAQCNERYKHL